MCIEIPFLDGPEGACSWTLSKKNEIVPREKWAEEKPFMLMIDVKYWTVIKKDWKAACRRNKSCEAKLESVDKIITDLNQILEQVHK